MLWLEQTQPDKAPCPHRCGGSGSQTQVCRREPSLQATLCFVWLVSDEENLPVVPAHQKTAHLLIWALETTGKSSPEAEPELSSDANKIWLRFRSRNLHSTCSSAARTTRASSAASTSSHCLQGNKDSYTSWRYMPWFFYLQSPARATMMWAAGHRMLSAAEISHSLQPFHKQGKTPS